jgi:gas vesicle protein
MRFLLGFGIGLVLGIVFAPGSGEQTRRMIREKADELAQLPEKKAARAADAAKNKAGEIGARVGRQAGEAAVEAVKDDVLGQRDKSA